MEILDHDTMFEMYEEYKELYLEEEGETSDRSFDQYVKDQIDRGNIHWDDHHDRYYHTDKDN